MPTEEALAAINQCQSLPELRDCLQRTAENFGFSSFNFLDIGNPHEDIPFYIGTTGSAWEADYKGNGFVHVDHCVHHARRTNVPFTWDQVPVPGRRSGPKPGVVRLMEAAQDHGFHNGLVIPFHFHDERGRTASSLSVFYWKNDASRLPFLLNECKHDLHIILIYWVQRAMDLVAEDYRKKERLIAKSDETDQWDLTDRERDVLAWAARGKTADETSQILGISGETVGTHVRNSMNKLNAANKTHAVAKALTLGVIDI